MRTYTAQTLHESHEFEQSLSIGIVLCGFEVSGTSVYNAYLDVRWAVGGQVDVEAVVVVVGAHLLVDQDHPMVLHRLACLNDGAHRRQ